MKTGILKAFDDCCQGKSETLFCRGHGEQQQIKYYVNRINRRQSLVP